LQIFIIGIKLLNKYLQYIKLKIQLNQNQIILTILLFFIYVLTLNMINDQNKRMGFDNGIIYGKIGNTYYSDEINYFKDMQYLKEKISEKGLMAYIKGEIADKGYYGPYNIYVLFLTILSFLGIQSPFQLIIVKIIFSLLLFNLCIYFFKNFLSTTKAIIASLLLVLFPEFILVTSSLLRDNIITFFFMLNILFLYKFYENAYNYISIIIWLICFIILLFLRPYSIIGLLPFFVIICMKNKKILYSLLLIVFFAILLFLPFIKRIYYQYSLANSFWAGVYYYKTVGLNFIMYSLLYTYWGHNHWVNQFNFYVLQEYFTFLSYQLLHLYLVLPLLLFLFVRNKLNKKIKYIFLLSNISSYLYIALYIKIFGGIIPRIYIPVLVYNVFFIVYFIDIYILHKRTKLN